MAEPVYETNLNYPLIHRGKVRDTYDLGENLLMIATDRLSAFDVVFKQPIPKKGEVLTQLSKFWFEKTNHIIKNHVIHNKFPEDFPEEMKRRSMVTLKAKPLKIECVVRGYLTGSGYKEYSKTGEVCGIKLPEGLKNGSKLENPIFTPATKAETGHDINIDEQQAKEIVGNDTFEFAKNKAVELYKFGRDYVLERGLVLADTKFEFGIFNEEIILIDEILTPDSSRYWLKSDYEKGKLLSLDKQYVRDYLETLDWNKQPPAPTLPPEVISKTTERYLQAYKMITGKDL
ncbi:phosphoribosylaminoimidazolesuccinocarboxamide synthase [Candidatus Micrarchaeota archaeon]|nr:phosphoribosylaminoimidazolesuccinocarboxamide synthase [Candidatus Micrarchaeota archaeon]